MALSIIDVLLNLHGNSWSMIEAQKHTHTHPLLLRVQLLILLSVTPEMLRKLHLAVYGLSQVLGQDVLTSLMRTQQWQEMRHKREDTCGCWIIHCQEIISYQEKDKMISLTGSSFSTFTCWQGRLLTSCCSGGLSVWGTHLRERRFWNSFSVCVFCSSVCSWYTCQWQQYWWGGNYDYSHYLF